MSTQDRKHPNSRGARHGRARPGGFMRALIGIAAGGLFMSSPASAQYIPDEVQVMFRVTAPPGSSAPTAKGWDCLIVGNSGADDRPSRFAWGDGSAGQPNCGLSSEDQLLENRQAVWLKSPVRVPGHQRVFYVLEMRLPNDSVGRCLMSDRWGNDSLPSLERKEGGPGVYCGWTSAEIVGDPRALWDVSSQGPIRSHKTNKCLMFYNNGYDVAASLYRWPDRPDDIDYCGLGYSLLRESGQAWFTATGVDPNW